MPFDEQNINHFYSIDFFEFLIAVSLTSSKDATQKIDLFFSMYDRDQNGLIDINEMRDFLEVSLVFFLDWTDEFRLVFV